MVPEIISGRPDLTEDNETFRLFREFLVLCEGCFPELGAIVTDPGAYNWEVPGSVLEKDVVLDIGTHVYSWVDNRSDATAYMTRYDDSGPSLTQRVNDANTLYQDGQCDIFVSVHSNSQSDASGNQLHTAQGIETYYKKSIDQELAADVHAKAKGAYFGSSLKLLRKSQHEVREPAGAQGYHDAGLPC